MPRSHPFLILAAAAALWTAGHWLAGPRDASTPRFLGVPGSAYGSLTARLVRDALHSYWHGGESAAQSSHDKPEAKNPPPPAGVFSRRAAPPPQVQELPWLDARLQQLARLEKARTKRNSSFPTSDAHRRYLEASANWRLKAAYELDRSDATLYEILHFQLAARAAQDPRLLDDVVHFADQAIDLVDAPMAGFSAALTGAGAAINLLNDLLAPGQARRDDEAILRRWRQLETCLQKFQAIREQGQAEGWWQGIPEIRRQEVESHAALLARIAESIRKMLVTRGLLAGESPG